VLAVWDDLVYHEYGMPTSQEECDALGVTCQNGNSVVLRNHGLLTVGASIQGALRRMYMLERACEVEVIARGMNEEPAPIEPDVIRQYGERARQQRAHPEYGMTYWKAAFARSRASPIDLSAVFCRQRHSVASIPVRAIAPARTW
jgi:ribulose-5-phosphate 4-epimerase/fuculose-1-phosphate aldolase